MKNLIAITIGDPKGIGPEVVAKAFLSLTEEERSHILIYGDMAALSQAAELAGTEFDHKHVIITSSTPPPIRDMADSEAARAAISAIDAAIADAIAGKVKAIVTAPVNKHRMCSTHPGFIGHTEYIAAACHVKDATMMFAPANYMSPEDKTIKARRACISLVTTHLPLREAPGAIKTARILTTIRHTHAALDKYFACPDARIAVMSLNPHAGEGQTLGTEEKEFIAPAIARAAKEGINCLGPLAADGLFRNLDDFDYDAVIAMYHDQGLIPAKLLCGKCVNVTLGLPFIRTSPGHGTAEDIAWLGKADGSGMLASIKMARRLVGW